MWLKDLLTLQLNLITVNISVVKDGRLETIADFLYTI